MKKYIVKTKLFLNIPLSDSDNNFMFCRDYSALPQFSGLEKFKNEVSLLYKQKIRLFIRLFPHSDFLVLRDVLVMNEYAIATHFSWIILPVFLI